MLLLKETYLKNTFIKSKVIQYLKCRYIRQSIFEFSNLQLEIHSYIYYCLQSFK